MFQNYLKMIRILINDGIDPTGKQLLQEAGFDVVTEKIPQEELPTELQKFDAISVRSATKVRAALIDACPNLKLIGRGGVGLDNIDVDYAKSKGIKVINTPAASSRSVAELCFAHLLGLVRSVHHSNRNLNDKNFDQLKKSYSSGLELEGKTIGIIGLGRIGQEAASIALGLGMKVLAADPFVKETKIPVGPKHLGFSVDLTTTDFETVIQHSDMITLHVPSLDTAIIGAQEIAKMKEGVILLNMSRGGLIKEDALIEALENGKVAAAGLDVFENEPTPNPTLLTHPRVSITPHTGASTLEAQEKIGADLAKQIIDFFGRQS